MTMQTPNPTAQANEPAAWITTGTPTGSGDPKTVEMLATIQRLTQAYGATDITTVGPSYANKLLLPDGTIGDLSLAYFDPSAQWMADAFASQAAQKRFLILYWGPRMPTQTVHATDETLALNIHNAIITNSVNGQYTGGAPSVLEAERNATASAPASTPTFTGFAQQAPTKALPDKAGVSGPIPDTAGTVNQFTGSIKGPVDPQDVVMTEVSAGSTPSKGWLLWLLLGVGALFFLS